MTREEAIAIAESGEWQEWSSERIVSTFLFQGGRLFLPLDDLYEALEKAFGRPVYTHELMESNIDNLIDEFSKDREPPTQEEIIELIPEEKRIVIDLSEEDGPSDIGDLNWLDDSSD